MIQYKKDILRYQDLICLLLYEVILALFKENTLHKQEKLFDNLSGMDHRYKKKLENSWAGLFYKHVFCKIDEKLFEPLYSSDNGRPNFPINKSMFRFGEAE